MSLFSDDMRRNPFPVYDQLRAGAPVFHEPQRDLWLILDYEGVKRALNDHSTFSSRYGPEWLVFLDPPRPTQMRAPITRALTPRSVARPQPRLRALARGLPDAAIERRALELAAD